MGAMGDEPGETSGDDARKELGEALLKDTREELGRADGKAAMLMSASGVVVSVLLAGAIAGKWDPTELGHWQWLWWPGAAAGAIGIVAFAAAVWPRDVHEEPKEKLAYFGHAAQYEKVGDLETALDEKALSSKKDRTTDQLLTVSKIVRSKFQLIRWGMGLLGVALVMCSLAVTLALTL